MSPVVHPYKSLEPSNYALYGHIVEKLAQLILDSLHIVNPRSSQLRQKHLVLEHLLELLPSNPLRVALPPQLIPPQVDLLQHLAVEEHFCNAPPHPLYPVASHVKLFKAPHPSHHLWYLLKQIVAQVEFLEILESRKCLG
ncbi:hypothetical protein [Encephalitozoon cuniculi GB-M1]|uniref:Uncharacterized protein n=1 Tax=Encephalitozoon cuniculi (strain GB-M1) TaxID=284813 RepID=Q8SVF9_ENCCU|nr:uncharacterized protein ECU05_1570 [Encephalitozoon cuniculi GB-M1]CAD26677.2 hypothetical protein [Encephalitozoon cuniculi GB-M1]